MVEVHGSVVASKKKYGFWRVCGPVRRRGKNRYWQCACKCGTVREVYEGHLKSGASMSYGCRHPNGCGRLPRHGEASKRTREYQAWKDMHTRCRSKQSRNYKNYGARGVRVCLRWSGVKGFANFLIDMGRCPDRYTLDRKNSNRGYSPSNCRWADVVTQNRNQRRSIYLVLGGVRRHVIEWAAVLGVKPDLLRRRKIDGWTDRRALTTPQLTRKNQVI